MKAARHIRNTTFKGTNNGMIDLFSETKEARDSRATPLKYWKEKNCQLKILHQVTVSVKNETQNQSFKGCT